MNHCFSLINIHVNAGEWWICRKLAKRDWLFKMSNYAGHNVSQGFHTRGIKFLRTKGSIDCKHAFIQSRQETGKAQKKSHSQFMRFVWAWVSLASSVSMIKEQIWHQQLQTTSYDQYHMFMCVCHQLTTRTGSIKHRRVRKADLTTRTRIDQFRARIH